jgi:toxin secretion/phage lysis holin
MAYWGALPPTVHTLVLLAVVDYASGTMVACSGGQLNSAASFRGVAKKTMMFLLTGACGAIQPHFGIDADLAAGVAGFFCATELISITENAGKLGVPLPGVLVRFLARLREQMD